MNGVLAQLRHLYANLVNGAVADTASAKRIAEGLLAPVIESLERAAPSQDAEDTLSQRITAYLSSGGLFNPELANHEAVRDLLIDCRAALTQPQPAVSQVGDKAVPEDIEHLAVNRYRPVPAGVLAYKVVGGDGARSLFSGTKDECQIVARKLTEAFLDGAYAALSQPQEAAPSDNERKLRRMLCVAYAGSLAYMDDGEMQDSAQHPFIDFLRDSADEIQAKFQQRGAKAMAAPSQDAEDAARLDWLLLRVSGSEFRRIGVHYSGNAQRADVDAARAQEGK